MYMNGWHWTPAEKENVTFNQRTKLLVIASVESVAWRWYTESKLTAIDAGKLRFWVLAFH